VRADRDRSNKFAGRIHDRKPEDFGAWLNGSAGPEPLKPADEELLQAWPVSKRVNRPGNDEDVSLAELIEMASFKSVPPGRAIS
jgi:putative SOS response-associated peptidase YedK